MDSICIADYVARMPIGLALPQGSRLLGKAGDLESAMARFTTCLGMVAPQGGWMLYRTLAVPLLDSPCKRL